MRIIAGVAKGRILGEVAKVTRPTSDRAREGLFSSLTSEFGDFLGLHVLDMFAGSGAIGLEALSRGASLVDVVEQDSNAQKTIENNFDLVKKNQPVGKFHLYSMSVQSFVSQLPKEKYHIVYIDPPFDFTENEIKEVLAKLHTGVFLNDGALLAIERTARSFQFSWPDGFAPARRRNYGAASIYFGNYVP